MGTGIRRKVDFQDQVFEDSLSHICSVTVLVKPVVSPKWPENVSVLRDVTKNVKETDLI